MRPRRIAAVLSLLAFVILVVAANYLTSRYGLMPIGFGLVVTAGTWAAGLVLLARDAVHASAGRISVAGAIVAGAALSLVLAPPALALASGAAFAVSELADWAVYEPLRRRGWARAAMASGVVGSAVDTILFLALAGFPVWSGLPGQMIVKVGATLIVVGIVVCARAVLRHRLRPAGA